MTTYLLLLTTLVSFELKVTLDPPTLLLRPGESRHVQMLVEDADGNPVTPKTVMYEILPPELGDMESGVFTAREEGFGVLRAVVMEGGRQGIVHASIEISKGKLRVRLEPERGALEPGERLQFSVSVFGPGGDEIEHPDVTWEVVPSWLGSVNDGGLFTSSGLKGAGKVIAIASDGARRGIANSGLIVGRYEDFEIKLVLEPGFAMVRPGEETIFSHRITEGPSKNLELQWDIDPPYLGDISKEGIFRPKVERGRGALWLLARSGDKVGAARAVIVVGPRVPDLWIEPRGAVIRPGTRAEFRLEGSPGAKIVLRNRKPPMNWSAEGTIGKVIGTDRGPSAVFEAGARAGLGFARLDIGRFQKMQLTVQAPVIVGEHEVSLSPRAATAGPGESITFTPHFPGDRRLPLEWRVVPREAGEITEDGTLTIRGGGEIFVIALVPDDLGGGGGIAVIQVE
jgi:hypothetical protein